MICLKQSKLTDTTTMTTLKRTDSTDEHFIELVALLDKDLAERDGDEHAFYAQFNKTGLIRNAIICYVDEQPVGCGAFRPFDETTVEIKRMFVQPGYRGNGIGLKIVRELETWAAEAGFTGCVLETGKKQPEAISLYRKAGYEVTENYGQYKNVENSVCMARLIV